MSGAERHEVGLHMAEKELRAQLEAFQAENREVNIFLRADDVGKDERGLRQLFDVGLSGGVSLHVEVIPGILTDSSVKLLKTYQHFGPTLLELNQHDWHHLSHDISSRKTEFAVNRQ